MASESCRNQVAPLLAILVGSEKQAARYLCVNKISTTYSILDADKKVLRIFDALYDRWGLNCEPVLTPSAKMTGDARAVWAAEREMPRKGTRDIDAIQAQGFSTSEAACLVRKLGSGFQDELGRDETRNLQELQGNLVRMLSDRWIEECSGRTNGRKELAWRLVTNKDVRNGYLRTRMAGEKQFQKYCRMKGP